MVDGKKTQVGPWLGRGKTRGEETESKMIGELGKATERKGKVEALTCK